jgi:hypothetical protein
MRRPLSRIAILLLLPLGLTNAALAQPEPQLDACAEVSPRTSERAVLVRRERPCAVAIPAQPDPNFGPSVLTLYTLDPQGEFSAKYTPDDITWAKGVEKEVAGPSAVVHTMESSASGARQSFARWGYPAAKVVITRQDGGPDEIVVRIETTSGVASLSDGHAIRMTIDQSDYGRLIDYGRCSNGGPDETKCLEGMVHLSPWTNGLQFTSQKDKSTADIYYLVSRWMGRDPAAEFIEINGRRQNASKSEPIVLFVGAAGVNRTVLLDCQGRQRSEDRCKDFAGPSAKTLERARYFWAVYVEDEETPFETSIDIEFGPALKDREYDEFDPRLRPNPATTKGLRAVKIGWRRFYIREAPVTVQVGFTRQGANYGLRQWVRVYRQRSKTWIQPAAAIFVPVNPPRKVTDALASVYADGALQPSGVSIEQNAVRRPIMALLALQWPQWRGKADDASAARRLLINLIPDAALGMAEDSMYFVGGSWPIPFWRDRSFVTAGGLWTNEVRARSPFAVGQRFAVTTNPNDILEERARWRFRIGLSIEILKLRR